MGSGIDAGVRELEINSSYYWMAVEGTNLAVCVVLRGTGTETVLKITSYGKIKLLCMSVCVVYVQGSVGRKDNSEVFRNNVSNR